MDPVVNGSAVVWCVMVCVAKDVIESIKERVQLGGESAEAK